jgi:hypothetical protein
MTAGSTKAKEAKEEKGAEKTKATECPWLHFVRFNDSTLSANA